MNGTRSDGRGLYRLRMTRQQLNVIHDPDASARTEFPDRIRVKVRIASAENLRRSRDRCVKNGIVVHILQDNGNSGNRGDHFRYARADLQVAFHFLSAKPPSPFDSRVRKNPFKFLQQEM